MPSLADTGSAPSDAAGSSGPDVPPALGRRAWLVPALTVAWTLFVWVTRIKNAWEDEGLETATRLGTTALSLSFVLLAVGTALAAWHLRRGRVPSTVDRWSLRLIGGWSLVVWALRVPQILAADHSVPFKAVHTVLGVVSIGLALATLWVAGRWIASSGSGAGDRSEDGGSADGPSGLLGGRC